MTGFLDADGQPPPNFNSQLRARGVRIPFLLATGTPEADVEVGRPLPLGVPFLEKPYRMDELQAAVQQALDEGGSAGGST